MRNIKDDADGHAQRVGEGRPQADPRGQAAGQRARRRPSPRGRTSRTGRSTNSCPMVDSGLKAPRLRPGPHPLRRGGLLLVPPVQQRGRRRGPRADRPGRPVHHPRPARIDRPARARSSATSTPPTIFSTTDGRVVTGRIMNLHNDTMTVNTNMLDPSAQVNIDRRTIEEQKPSPVSMMPEGLLEHAEPRRGARPGRLPALARRPEQPDVQEVGSGPGYGRRTADGYPGLGLSLSPRSSAIRHQPSGLSFPGSVDDSTTGGRQAWTSRS